jgi:hypothetical protein
MTRSWVVFKRLASRRRAARERLSRIRASPQQGSFGVVLSYAWTAKYYICPIYTENASLILE